VAERPIALPLYGNGGAPMASTLIIPACTLVIISITVWLIWLRVPN